MSTAIPQQLRHGKKIPPLENGDRLDRLEFERRYEAMPNHVKAELIQGVVYMASPARHGLHGQQHARIIAILGNYMMATPGTDTGSESSLILDMENEPQPDALLRIVEEAGGQSHVDDDGYLHGGPELVAEVAASSVSYDLGPKLATYKDQGVREYLVWRVQDQAFNWFVLREGEYKPLTPDAAGIIKSERFPGLWLNVKALLQDDMAMVLQVLQQGLAGDEHQAFVAQLARRMGKDGV